MLPRTVRDRQASVTKLGYLQSAEVPTAPAPALVSGTKAG